VIYKHQNGVWRIDFTDARVGRVHLSARTKKKAEANRREAAIRALIDQGETEIVGRIGKSGKDGGLHIADVQEAVEAGSTDQLRPSIDEPFNLGAACGRLMRTVEATLEPGTVTLYRSLLVDLERHFGVRREHPMKRKPRPGEDLVLSDVPLVGITSDLLREWLHEPKRFTGRPWSPKRQAVARAVITRLWRTEIARASEHAEVTGGRAELTRNPVAQVDAPRLRQTRVVFLHPEEWRTLIGRTQDRPIAAALGLWCLAGLRLMEAAHLRTGIDVLLEAPVPHVKIQPRGGEYPWKPKTDRSIRTVPLSRELREILRRHIELGFAGDRYFLRPEGEDRPYKPGSLRRYVIAAYQAAGIKYGRVGDALTAHSLRHTFASWLAQRDVQMLKIAHLLGDTVEQVSKTYAHLLPSDLERAVAVIDDVIHTGREKA
jgi:integrase